MHCLKFATPVSNALVSEGVPRAYTHGRCHVKASAELTPYNRSGLQGASVYTMLTPPPGRRESRELSKALPALGTCLCCSSTMLLHRLQAAGSDVVRSHIPTTRSGRM